MIEVLKHDRWNNVSGNWIDAIGRVVYRVGGRIFTTTYEMRSKGMDFRTFSSQGLIDESGREFPPELMVGRWIYDNTQRAQEAVRKFAEEFIDKEIAPVCVMLIDGT